MELLAVRRIEKYFPATKTLANAGISLRVDSGEIRAVVGENGAGKSTLARIIAGIIEADSGEMAMRGKILRFGGVRAAERAGIGIVPQHSFLAADLSVAENLALGREPIKAGIFLDRRRADLEAAELAAEFGFHLDPEAIVRDLAPAERRQADIMRALARGGDLLILDEPTSLLTGSETEGLFALLRRLSEAGKGILYITHRVAEVRSLARSITVLRGGKVAADLPAGELEECELSGLMARAAASAIDDETEDRKVGRPVLEAKGLVLDPRFEAKPFSLEVRAGEIVGIAALAGNGLDRLEDAIAGLRRPALGNVRIDGKSIASIPRNQLRSRLMSYVPAARDTRGLALGSSLLDNLIALERDTFHAFDWMSRVVRGAVAERLSSSFKIEAELSAQTAFLSGGNRQRLLLSRELDRSRPFALLVEPTQGLDVAAQEDAASRIRALARSGVAVLLLTSNLDELLLLADRVGVLYRCGLAHFGENEGGASMSLLTARMTGLVAA